MWFALSLAAGACLPTFQCPLRGELVVRTISSVGRRYCCRCRPTRYRSTRRCCRRVPLTRNRILEVHVIVRAPSIGDLVRAASSAVPGRPSLTNSSEFPPAARSSSGRRPCKVGPSCRTWILSPTPHVPEPGGGRIESRGAYVRGSSGLERERALLDHEDADVRAVCVARRDYRVGYV